MRFSTLVATLLIAVAPAFADDDPENIVKYRDTVMSSMGKHMKAATMILRGEITRSEDFVGHARALQAASRNLPALWPQSTKKLKNDSLPAIWKRFDDFQAKATALEAATDGLVEAAESGEKERWDAALGDVGRACGSCHDNFKRDEDR